LSTGLFGAYLGNPRLPRAYATAGNCTTAAGNAGTDTIVSDITEFKNALTNANAALCDDITLAAGTFNLSDSAMSSMVQTRTYGSLTYHSVTITSSVTIHGASGTQTSIITGGGATSHDTDMYFKAAMVTGRVELQDLSVNHAGIKMIDTGTDRVGTTLAIDHVNFNHNTQVQGAVSADYLHDVSVDNSTFSYNSSSAFANYYSQSYLRGAAVSGSGTSAMTITDTTFVHNTAEWNGGAVYGGYDLSVSGGSFSDNQAGSNGGVIWTYGQLTVSGTSFSHNYASNVGGAINSKSTTTISDSTFSHNSAGARGGAISATGYGSLQISTSTLSHNSAAYGGGLLSSKADVTISDSVFDHNTVSNVGGGAFLVPLGLNPSTIAVSGSTFSDNSAVGSGRTTGGALYWLGFNGPTSTSVSLANSTFSGNYEHSTGGFDGAAAITFDSGDPLVTMDSLTFSGNHGKYLNHLYGHGHLFNSVFDGNTVTGAAQNWIEGTGVAWTGDHLFEQSGTPFMQSSVVPWTDTSPLTGASGSALLGALGTNAGGSTQTMLPGAGSPLIGAGSTSQAHDQNGTVRSGAVTIGAVHVSPSASYTITYNGNSNTSGSVPSTTTGSGSVTLRSNSGSLARTGYTFAGWNTLANGTGTSYAAGAAYTLSASVTLYAQWTANGGGGGGGGGGSSTDSSTTSTPVVTRRPVVAAVPLGTSSLPTGGVTPGSSFLLVDGVPRAVTVKPDAPVTSQAKGLVASGDGFTLRMSGLDAVGAPLGVTVDAALVLERDHSVQVQGSGFDPNSDVQVYVFSQARLLGTVHTDATGAFSGLVQVPGDLELGHHTLQIDALHADGTVRSLSLGVVLEAPQAAASQKTARVSVEFDAGSARLSAAAKKQLTSLARRAGATASAGMVVGYVQRDGNYAKNQKLSAQRARAVARFLSSHGVKGTLVTHGNGALSVNDTARKAVVTLRYTG